MQINNYDLLQIKAQLQSYSQIKIHLFALLTDNWTCCLRVLFQRSCLKSKGRQNFDLLERGMQKNDEQLDIRNLIKMQIDIQILVNLLLTKPQRWLFKNQRCRTLTINDSSDVSDSYDVENLFWWPVRTNLGKLLVKGIFQHDPHKKNQEAR
jgi:hypothetical protein